MSGCLGIGERNKILYWVGMTFGLLNYPDRNITERDLIKILRMMGLSFKTSTFVRIKDRALTDLYINPDVIDYLSD